MKFPFKNDPFNNLIFWLIALLMICLFLYGFTGLHRMRLEGPPSYSISER